jgi:hypothetical protein
VKELGHFELLDDGSVVAQPDWRGWRVQRVVSTPRLVGWPPPKEWHGGVEYEILEGQIFSDGKAWAIVFVKNQIAADLAMAMWRLAFRFLAFVVSR